MGHIVRTDAGTWRANWRDAAGRQKAKTFPTKKSAAAFLAETVTALNHGAYVDPHAGRQRFGPYATRWLAARNHERTTAARDGSIMGVHVLPRWEAVPLSKIDHLAVQAWVTELGGRLAPASVGACFRLFSGVMRSAMRDQLVGSNPADGVRLPRQRKTDQEDATITPAALVGRLLPVVPDRYRALVALAGGTGLRWGECAGLRWDAVDLDGATVRVSRTVTEVAGHVVAKPYPKTRAGRRVVPLPPFVLAQLRGHRDAYPAGPAGEVFTNTAGGPLRRTLFRSRVWRPALVRAGLLGSVAGMGPDKWRATWTDAAGVESSAEFTTGPAAVAHVARTAAGGLRFHDLRHSYATWLVSRGVPINDVQRAMGHERASVTLDRYTHRSDHQDEHVRGAFADDSLTLPVEEDPETAEEPPEGGS